MGAQVFLFLIAIGLELNLLQAILIFGHISSQSYQLLSDNN